jgi:hypothetical protein
MNEKMVAVELVLDIERHVDQIYATGAIWSGKGDVQMVPAQAAVLMHRNHPDVYFVHGATERPAAEVVVEAENAAANIESVSVTVNPHTLSVEDLAAMSDEDVHAQGKARGYTLHPRLNPENLRATFLKAQGATSAGLSEETRVL